MFHFNIATRVSYWEGDPSVRRARGLMSNLVSKSYQLRPVWQVKGFDHCYDCAAEAYILKDYLRVVSHHQPTCMALQF
jgi:hypothetical protein